MRLLPRVVCSIDGSTLPVQDYSFTSVANGGYHEFRGQAPVRNLLALGADQEAPLTVYHEETGDILWDGRFVEDPEIDEGVGLISATGPKSELEKNHGRLLFQVYPRWTAADGNPHNYTFQNPQRVQVSPDDGRVTFTINGGETLANADHNGVAFWAGEGTGIIRIAFTWLADRASGGFLTLHAEKMAGPTGAGSTITTYAINGTNGTEDTTVAAPILDQVVLFLSGSVGVGLIDPTYRLLLRDLRVNSIASGDTYYAHEVLQHLAGRVKFNTSLIETSGLNVLPLDWSGSWAALASYIVSLLDWRWLVSTVPTPGTGLVQYLEAGPWEREWTLFKGSRARPNLKPQQRRAVQLAGLPCCFTQAESLTPSLEPNRSG